MLLPSKICWRACGAFPTLRVALPVVLRATSFVPSVSLVLRGGLFAQACTVCVSHGNGRIFAELGAAFSSLAFSCVLSSCTKTPGYWCTDFEGRLYKQQVDENNGKASVQPSRKSSIQGSHAIVCVCVFNLAFKRAVLHLIRSPVSACYVTDYQKLLTKPNRTLLKI